MSETSMDALRGMNAGLVPVDAPQQSASTSNLEEARAIAQIQGGMIMAKRFRRDEQLALTKVLSTCNVIQFADEAEFAFPRGGKTVRGPTIRLLEEICRHWGNLEWNVMELNRSDTESLASTYCVDLENNTWARRQFVVPHTRDKNEDGGRGNVQQVILKSDRDIYEKIANMGSRRVRACMEQLIPKYIVDAAVDRCRETKSNRDRQTPLADRITRITEAFGKRSVTPGMLGKWLKGRPLKDMLENEYQDLYAIYTSIKDGYARIEEHFEQPTVAENLATARQTPAQSQQKPPQQQRQAPPPADGELQKTPPAKEPAATKTADNEWAGAPGQPAEAQETKAQPVSEGPTKEKLFAEVDAAKGVDTLQAIGLKASKLSKEDFKAVKLRVAARVKDLQAAERQASTDSDTSIE